MIVTFYTSETLFIVLSNVSRVRENVQYIRTDFYTICLRFWENWTLHRELISYYILPGHESVDINKKAKTFQFYFRETPVNWTSGLWLTWFSCFSAFTVSSGMCTLEKCPVLETLQLNLVDWFGSWVPWWQSNIIVMDWMCPKLLQILLSPQTLKRFLTWRFNLTCWNLEEQILLVYPAILQYTNNLNTFNIPCNMSFTH